MPDIRYVILSDLHFGAENSLLSALESPDNPVCDPSRLSPVLSAFVDCLAAVVQTNEGSTPPTLILAGDILELALAEDDVAATVFEQFTNAVTGDHGLFANEIWFVPGNHDHHLWETARELHYAKQIRALTPTDPIPPPSHATRLFTGPQDPAIEADLLTAVVQRRLQTAQVSVRTVYPNFGLTNSNGRAVIVHHGHFIESMYLLMSNLNQLMFGRPLPSNVLQLEAENFAWIDFFWSSLGRSGDVGEDVNRLYDMLQSEQAVERLVLTLAAAISERAPGGRSRRWMTRRVTRDLLTHVARRAGRLERHHPTAALSANAQEGLQRYLAGPLLAQITGELPAVPATTLVFGHTHKPFEETLEVPGFSSSVALANTGGWVVDTIQTSPFQGAAAVLVDEDLNVASLRLYNQADNASDYASRLVPVSPQSSDLVRQVGDRLHFDAGPWRSLASATAKTVVERHNALQTIINRSNG
jgi:predicted phosphodiesterase